MYAIFQNDKLDPIRKAKYKISLTDNVSLRFKYAYQLRYF